MRFFLLLIGIDSMMVNLTSFFFSSLCLRLCYYSITFTYLLIEKKCRFRSRLLSASALSKTDFIMYVESSFDKYRHVGVLLQNQLLTFNVKYYYEHESYFFALEREYICTHIPMQCLSPSS